MASYSNPSPDTHVEVLYRQTYNSVGAITAAGLTQNNTVGNAQKANNARWVAAKPPLGILAGSVVAVAGDFSIGPCAGDSSATFDKAVGIAVNNAVGNPYESSSAVASGKAVYAHGTGTVFNTDIYETKQTDGTANVSYTAGDKLYASRNGLLTNVSGMDNTNLTYSTLIGICLKAPNPSDPYMAVQLRI
jgi:hypothetical protein